jgi:hypothetical protein
LVHGGPAVAAEGLTGACARGCSSEQKLAVSGENERGSPEGPRYERQRVARWQRWAGDGEQRR